MFSLKEYAKKADGLTYAKEELALAQSRQAVLSAEIQALKESLRLKYEEQASLNTQINALTTFSKE